MANDCVYMSLDHDDGQEDEASCGPAWRTGVLAAKALGDLTTARRRLRRRREADGDAACSCGTRTARGQEVYAWTVNDPAWMLTAHEPRRRRADHRTGPTSRARSSRGAREMTDAAAGARGAPRARSARAPRPSTSEDALRP